MKKIWAVARNMIAQGIRMKVMLVVLVFAVLTIFIFPFTLRGEGTLKGKLQLFITYDLSMLSLLLSVLTIALSTASLCGEIKGKQIYILDTKPVRRWQILVGKWTGIVILDLVLLAVMGLASFLMLQYIYRRSDATKQERAVVRNEFLTARRAYRPPVLDIDRQVDEEYKKLEAMGRLPEVETVEDARHEIYRRLMTAVQSVEPGKSKQWIMTAIPLPVNRRGPIIVRFKFYSTATMKGREVAGKWDVGDPATGQPVRKDTNTIPESFQEFQVPADVVQSGREIRVAFHNVDPSGTTIVFPPDEGVEVLIRVGGFAPNFARGLMLIFFRLMFLAALGLFCSTFLTFPVAAITTLCVFLAAMASGFIGEIAEKPTLFTPEHHHGPAPKSTIADKAVRAMLKGISTVLPKFSRYNPVPELNNGNEISDKRFAEGFVVFVIFYAGLLLCSGSLIFQQRQLAALHG